MITYSVKMSTYFLSTMTTLNPLHTCLTPESLGIVICDQVYLVVVTRTQTPGVGVGVGVNLGTTEVGAIIRAQEVCGTTQTFLLHVFLPAEMLDVGQKDWHQTYPYNDAETL
jgi:hypothetical protein